MEKFSTKHNWAKTFTSILCIVLFSVSSLFSQTTVFVEDFNTWSPGPTLGTWTFESYDPATGSAITAPLGAWNYNGIAYDPPFSAYHDWWAGNATGGYPAYNDWMISSEIDLSGTSSNLYLEWWNFTLYTANYAHYHDVLVSTVDPATGGANWTSVFVQFDQALANDAVWEYKSVDISTFSGGSIWLACNYQGQDASEWYVDYMSVIDYGATVLGCTDSSAANFDPNANQDDGSCYYAGLDCNAAVAAFDGVNTSPGQPYWFVYTAPADGQLNVSSIGSGVDTYLGLFSNCAVSNGFASSGDLGSNDDYGSFLFGEYESDLTISVFSGMNIYIFWEDAWTTSSFDFTITFTAGVGGCTDSTALNYNPTATYDDGSCVPFVYGCTDFAAMNYDAFANTDDGSCTYCTAPNSQISISMTTDLFAGEASWVITDSQGGVVATSSIYSTQGTYDEGSFCLADDCYTLNMYDSFGDGWCWAGSCGAVTISDASGNVILSAGVPSGSASATADFALGSASCGIPGCTDSTAANYDPSATVDDGSCSYCTDTQLYLSCGGGSWQGEVSWSISDGSGNTVASGGAPFSGDICVPDDCFQISMADSFGDGWNGNYLDITDVNGNVIGSYTIVSGLTGSAQFATGSVVCPIYGCTDAAAVNFDASANTDDGSCTYSCATAPICENFDSTLVFFTQSQTDGFDWAQGTATPSFQTGPNSLSNQGGSFMYTESSANYYNTAVLVSNCVDISGLTNPAFNFEYSMYGLTMGDLLVEVIDASGTATQVFYVFGEQGFDWNFASVDLSAWAGSQNISIQVSSTTGSSFTSDCAIDALCIGELVVTGCMDATACNYDANASVDDGSCEFLSCCTDNVIAVNMYDAWGDGWNQGSYTIVDTSGYVYSSGTISAGSVGTDSVCIPDGCAYVITVGVDSNGATAGLFAGEMAFDVTDASGTVLLSAGGAASGGGAGIYNLAIGTGCQIWGCTDAAATNYSSLATDDDGSCCFDNFISVTIQLPYFASECSWDFTDSQGNVIVSGGGYTTGVAPAGDSYLNTTFGPFCLADDCYIINQYDSFGDGWIFGILGDVRIVNAADGSTIALTPGFMQGTSQSTVVSGLGCAAGCTDSTASNFDPSANYDDGSCLYPCLDNVFTLNMLDAFGDGWNGNTFDVTNSSGAVVASATLSTGSSGSVDFCLPDDCYSYSVGGGSWQSEVTWALLDASGTAVAMGIAPQTGVFAAGSGFCTILGCTDSTALNFDPLANTDDGSCSYACAAPYYEDFDGGFGSWTQGTNTAFGGTDVADWSIGASTPSTMTGPQAGDVTGGNFVYMEATSIWAANAGVGQMTLNSECIDISALACPELTFWYNLTENPSFLGYMGSLAVTVNGTAVWSYGPGLNTSSCNDGWCLAVVDLSAFANETSATLSFIGTVGLNGYSDVSFDAVGVDECQAFGCTDSTALNYDPTASLDDGSCTYPVYGCTDATAFNYDPAATADDGSCYFCTTDVVTLNLYDSFGDGWAWAGLTNSVTINGVDYSLASGSVGSYDICVDLLTCIDVIFNCNALFCNENSWDVTHNGVIIAQGGAISGQIGACPIYGCTDAAALNFDPAANTDDGSCIYSCNASPYSENFDAGLGTWTNTGSAGNWTLDAAGTPSGTTGPSDDITGGGNYMYIESSVPNSPNIGPFTLTSECFDFSNYTDPCFSFYTHMYGSNMGTMEVFVNGTSVWSLSGDQGNVWAFQQVSLAAFAGQSNVVIEFTGTTGAGYWSDMAIDEVSIVDGCAVSGCTDPAACNYDPAATADDGSCEYMSCCIDNVVTVTCGGGSFQGEVSWSLISSTGTVVASGGAPFTGDFCLPDDCYTVDMQDSWGDGWNGNVLDVGGSTFTITSGFSNTDQVALGAGFCAVYGCTDAAATNFDPAANTDDGSCQYSCTAAPYSENFDAGLGTWTQDVTDMDDWILDASGTTSFGTGPSDDVTGGGNYLYTESSANYLVTHGLTSECFDISALTNPCFSFMYHMYGTAMGTLEVYVNGTLEWSLSGDQGDAWTYAQVSLAAYAGTDVTIQIVGTTGTSFTSDMAIDEVALGECAVTGCTDATACNYDPSASTDDGSCDFSCYGCTDATAANYDANATLDDGSCCFDNYLTLLMNDSWGDGWNGNTFTISDGSGSVLGTATLLAGSSGTATFCIPDGCSYSVTCGGGSFTSEVSWVLSDATGAMVSSGGAPASFTFDLNCAGVPGCTDPAAFNYDPSATVDDGSCCIGIPLTFYMMDAFGDGWNGNVGTLVNTTTGDTVISAGLTVGAIDSVTVCADPALLATSCFEMTVGGGFWQSEVSWYIVDQSTGLTILAGGAPFIYQFGNCPVYGCTDPSAINYDSTANVDDGSCCVGTFLSFNMYDSYGDGWNGNSGTLVNITTGDTLFSGVTMGCSGFSCYSDSLMVCADPAQLATGCFVMTVGGGLYQSEVSWSVVDQSTGLTILAGGAPFLYQFGNCPIPGCTDVNAGNYDSTATVDDGSCYYTGCTDPNADNYDSTATVDDGSCTYCTSLSGVVDFAIDASGAGLCDGTGSVSATGGTSPYNISWPSDPNTLCAGTYTVTVTDAAGCVTTVDVTIGEAVTVVSGCTDSTATNFDPLATSDDGSCTYPAVCADATNLNTTNVVHSRATFGWDNTGAEYYRIRVNTGSGWSILTQIGAADGFAHPNASKTRYFLTANTSYEWQVRGWCLDGSVSNWSASAFFTTLDDCPNATNLGATGVEGEWATMTWDAATAAHGVSHYLARVREVGATSWNIKGNIGNGLSKTIGSLAQGATYEFETRTWCNTGDANNPTDPYYKSDWSGNGQFTTVPCPVQTDNLGVTELTSTSADFAWTLISASPAADHFTIRFREIGATTWNLRSVAGGGTATGRTIGGFTSGVDYEWEVRTFCGSGSTWKSPWVAGPDFNLGSGARVNAPFSQLEVFPNPSRDFFNVSFVSDMVQNVTIKVVNMIGEEVHANELVEFVGQYTNKINLSTQPKGVYFLEITSDNGGINKKVVLQ